ncbi:MAG: hypothetical protein J6A75_13615 [Lachnospiraceae bacterium]|nr:hypothetical protein [Lachnospiraceae bacterium]
MAKVELKLTIKGTVREIYEKICDTIEEAIAELKVQVEEAVGLEYVVSEDGKYARAEEGKMSWEWNVKEETTPSDYKAYGLELKIEKDGNYLWGTPCVKAEVIYLAEGELYRSYKKALEAVNGDHSKVEIKYIN